MSSDFEDRVRERLHDAVATLPRDTTLTTRIMDATVEAPPRRHRTRSALHTWMPPLVAGAASVAVVVAVVVLATRTRPTGHARPTPGASTSVSVAPTSPPPAKTSSQPTSGTSSPTSPVAPSAADISRILTHTVETASPSTHFGDPSAPVTTSDGHGGTLTAVIAHRTPAADSHGYLVFFWHNNQFAGWDRNQEAMTTKAVTAAGPGAFSVTYANYAGNDPACCPSLAPVTIAYHWNGTRLQADQPVPPGVYGLNNPTATPVTVLLRWAPPPSSGPRTPPGSGTPTSSQPTTATSSPPPPVAPSAADISRILTHTVEIASPSTHFGDPSAPVTTGDGHGGTLTAVIAHRTPAADSHGYLVFFWHNNQFAGWDRNQEAMTTKAVTAAGPGAFSVTYANYAGNDPACCPSLAPVTITYHWNGTHLQADQPVPPGVYGLSNPTAMPVTVQLR